MSKIALRPITKDNYRDALRLKVKPTQETFVAPNAVSLVQAQYEVEDHGVPYGIYADDKMVGFIMTSEPEDIAEEFPKTLAVWRLMIGADYQGKGYGRAAMEKLIADAKANDRFEQIVLSYVPDNQAAQRFYASLGFEEIGVREDWGGEIGAKLKL